MSAAKMPKGLPALPDAPTGCVWEYMGKHWRGTADKYIFMHDVESEWQFGEGDTTAGPCHYCRAIKRPAKLKKPKRAKLAGVKAVVGYLSHCEGPERVSVIKSKALDLPRAADLFILPADAASVERMVEQITEAIMNGPAFPDAPDTAKRALSAIGITSAKGRK